MPRIGRAPWAKVLRVHAFSSGRIGGSLRAVLHCAALLALLSAMPGAPRVARELGSLFLRDDCCEHACESEECCPGQCLDCRYCGHASALTPMTLALALTAMVRLPHAAAPADLHRFAYVSPPARPPAG